MVDVVVNGAEGTNETKKLDSARDQAARAALNVRIVPNEEHDPSHTEYRNQRPPTGFRTCVAESIPVAGVSYRQRSVSQLVMDERARLDLRRDPTNPHSPDGSAIAVIGTWHDSSGMLSSDQVGFVPATIASELKQSHPDADLAATIECVFLPVAGKSAGIRMSIWAGAQQTPRTCDRCGAGLPNGAAFCPTCGAKADSA